MASGEKIMLSIVMPPARMIGRVPSEWRCWRSEKVSWFGAFGSPKNSTQNAGSME